MRMGRRSFGGGVLWLLVMITCGLISGCRHTPSYSDIKVDKGGGLANSNGAGPATDRSIEPGPLPTMPDSSPSPAASANPSSTPPAFFDSKTGQIRNLPLYPGSKVRGVQFGPINGTPQVSVQAMSRAPFEKVTAFYDQVVKENGWTIDDNSRGPKSCIWQIFRGDGARGAIRVDKDELGRVTISLARTN